MLLLLHQLCLIVVLRSFQVEHLGELADWRSFLGPYVADMHNHTFPRAFRFRMDAGVAIVEAKPTPLCGEWGSAQNFERIVMFPRGAPPKSKSPFTCLVSLMIRCVC